MPKVTEEELMRCSECGGGMVWVENAGPYCISCDIELIEKKAFRSSTVDKRRGTCYDGCNVVAVVDTVGG